jgi:hypothetical protein
VTVLRPTPRFSTTAFAGAGLGFGLWIVSPLVAGCAEPWDASFSFYLPVMLGAVTTAIGAVVSLPGYVAAAQIRTRCFAQRDGRPAD